MLRKVEFENFMSLKKTSVELTPLTVFIGPNGSGKSAVFKGLVTISKLLRGAALRGPRGEFFVLEQGVTLDDTVWSGNSGLPIIFRVWLTDDDDEPGYTLELRKRTEGWGVVRERIRAGDKWIEVDEDHPFEHPTERGPKVHSPPLRATLRYLVHPFVNDSAARPAIEPILELSDRLGLAWRYRPSASDIASFVQYPSPSQGSSARARPIYVRENGWGLAAVMQALQGSDRKAFEAIEANVRTLFPYIRTIGFKTDWQGVRLNFMTDRSEDPVPAPQESDGALLATFLSWRLFTAGPSDTICLEEPESGLHPELVGRRYELLREFAYATGSRAPVQILVATHSLELLREMHAHHSTLFEEARVVSFHPGKGTVIGKPKTLAEAGKLLERYLSATKGK